MLKIIIKDINGNKLLDTNKFLNKDFSFSEILGSGQTSLNLKLEYSKFDLVGMFAEVFYLDRLIFGGIIQDEKLNFDFTTNITIVGWFDLFNRIETNYNFDNAQSSINLLINRINERYKNYQFELITEGSEYFKNTSNSKGGSIINNIVKETSWDFFVGADRKVYFLEKLSNKIHKINLNEIIDGEIAQTSKNLVNYVYIRDESTSYNNYIQDDESIEKYGKAEKKLYGTYTEYQLAKVARDNLTGIQKNTRIKLKLDFNIKVGDFITIQNSPVEIKEVKIVKIDYTSQFMTLYLDIFETFAQKIK